MTYTSIYLYTDVFFRVQAEATTIAILSHKIRSWRSATSNASGYKERTPSIITYHVVTCPSYIFNAPFSSLWFVCGSVCCLFLYCEAMFVVVLRHFASVACAFGMLAWAADVAKGEI
jgi:hypothetical protein